MRDLVLKIKSEEIVRLLSSEINKFKKEIVVEEVGRVIEAGDGIARIEGLKNAMFGEMLKFGESTYGLP